MATVKKALVLAAGMGERLRPLTLRTPKPLLPVGGRPLIHYVLMMLKRGGVRHVVINLHHLGDLIKSAIGDGSSFGLEISYAPERELLGTGGPLVALKEFFADESFWVVNSDTILDLNLQEVAAFHRLNRALVTLVLTKEPPTHTYSKVEIDQQGRVQRILLLKRATDPASRARGTSEGFGRRSGAYDVYQASEVDSKLTTLTSLMFCGLSLCESELIDYAPARQTFGLISDLVAPLVVQGKAVYGYTHQGFFRTVDDLAGYEALRAEFDRTMPYLSFLKDPET